MTIDEFHNGLRILLNIDMFELEEAGVIAKDDMRAWHEFRDNPWRWFIYAQNAQADRLWALMPKSMK